MSPAQLILPRWFLRISCVVGACSFSKPVRHLSRTNTTSSSNSAGKAWIKLVASPGASSDWAVIQRACPRCVFGVYILGLWIVLCWKGDGGDVYWGWGLFRWRVWMRRLGCVGGVLLVVRLWLVEILWCGFGDVRLVVCVWNWICQSCGWGTDGSLRICL